MNAKLLIFIAVIVFLSSAKIEAQQYPSEPQSPVLPYYAPPVKDTKLVYELGLGMGEYYGGGTSGARFSAGGDLLSFDFGLGWSPFLASGPRWDISSGISVHLSKRYTPLRPKITAIYSTGGYTLNIMEKMTGTGPVEVLYQEVYQGMGILGGFDWRISKTSGLCVDFGMGFVCPFISCNELQQIYDEHIEDLELQGYEVEKSFGLTTVNPFEFLEISMGINYTFGRSLEIFTK